MIKITINGKEVAVEKGRTILEVAREAGIDIPTLCNHESLPPYAACRFCIVEVTYKGATRYRASCIFPVEEGMEIKTHSERVLKIRRVLAELMLARCPESDVIRDLAYDVGVGSCRFDRPRGEKAPCQICGVCRVREEMRIAAPNEVPSTFVGKGGCILCGMCIRLCDEVMQIGALTLEGRGMRRRVTTAFRKPSEFCIACGACSSICPTGAIELLRIRSQPPVAIPSEFEQGLVNRKPVHIPFPQAVPRVPVIDKETCVYFQTGGCKVCEDNCQVQAIDHTMQDRVEEIEVGNIILATGWKLFDCKRSSQYGYGRLANVYTNLEFERLCNAAGPTNGKIVLRDGKTEPKSVAIVHCVGSRDANSNPYCSAVCCMAALKFGHLVVEKTNAEVYAFYIDMRTNQKGYEEFYERLQEEGMQFVRGKVGEVTDAARQPSEEGKLIVQVDDTLLGKQRRIPVDMVILMGAMEPQADAKEFGLKCGISCNTAGWYTERHPKLDPVATMTDGVFVAGVCQGPKDIPAAVAQGAAAAARVEGMISKGEVMIEPIVASIDEERCSGCRICNNMCPYNAIEFDAEKSVSRVVTALCKGCGTCVAACPAGVITGAHFNNEQIFAEIDGILWDARPREEMQIAK
jgi:heterodisulfide reductase subunit A